jgi:acyl-coenzyme A thioesterase PaaI-like protein
VPLHHHDLCFGCGRANLFGLLAEVTSTAPGRVSGRCFIKQDHQGATPGVAHDGVLSAALSEAITLAAGPDARIAELTVSFAADAPVGTFVELEAVAEPDGSATARATVDTRPVARAQARVTTPG